MNNNEIKELIAQIKSTCVKGFLADDEAEALYHYSLTGSVLAPSLEIGSYCGKSTVILAKAAEKNNSVVFAVDHHGGSEEHQLGEEYFDRELYDEQFKCVNSFPLFQNTLRAFNCLGQVIPVVASSQSLAKFWATPLGFVFVDGGHSHESSRFDCVTWSQHIVPAGILAIHDIFERPEDGGQGPYLAMKEVLSTGRFRMLEKINSLVILQRTDSA